MVRIDAFVDVSAAIVLTTQNVSPNIHGYADQTRAPRSARRNPTTSAKPSTPTRMDVVV